jgi:hypothetical protein
MVVLFLGDETKVERNFCWVSGLNVVDTLRFLSVCRFLRTNVLHFYHWGFYLCG